MNEELEHTGKKIAICDDNEDITDYLWTVLTQAGYNVATANGYEELMPLLARFKPDLLILDIRMPKFDGFDVLEKLQEQAFSLPVFMVTAHDHFMYRNYAPVMGVREYMVKPIDSDVLLEKIKSLLGASSQA